MRSALGNPGLAHAVAYTLTRSQIARVVTRCARAEARDGEVWMERRSRSNRASCFPKLTQERQGGGEEMLRHGIISIDFNGAPKTRDRPVVAAEIELRDAGDIQPTKEIIVPGTETNRLLDLGLGFLEASDNNLGETDYCVSVGKVRVQNQSTFTFGDPLRGAVGEDLHGSHGDVGAGMVRRHRQRLGQRRLGRG